MTSPASRESAHPHSGTDSRGALQATQGEADRPYSLGPVAVHAREARSSFCMQGAWLTHTVSPSGMSVASRTSTTYSEFRFRGGQTLMGARRRNLVQVKGRADGPWKHAGYMGKPRRWNHHRARRTAESHSEAARQAMCVNGVVVTRRVEGAVQALRCQPQSPWLPPPHHPPTRTRPVQRPRPSLSDS